MSYIREEEITNEVPHAWRHPEVEFGTDDRCWVCGEEATFRYLIASNDPYNEGACQKHKNHTHFDTGLYRRYIYRTS